MHAGRPGAGHGFGSGWFPRFVALATAGLVVALAAGCDNGNDNDGAIAIDDLGASIEASYCRSAIACGAATEQAACEASLLISRDSTLDALVAAVKRGTLVYDGKRARVCIDEFERECIGRFGQPPACDETFRGTVAPGGACVLSNECQSGECTGACGHACCLGTCAAGPGRVVLGGDCTIDGAHCVGGAYCKGNKCVLELALGAACSVEDVCRSPGHCAIGLAGSGTCLGPPDQGATCAPGGEPCLRTNNYCDPTSLQCVRRKAPGAACTASSECTELAPCFNGVCTPQPTLGQPCEADGELRCLAALECLNGVCAVPPASPLCPP